MFAYFTNMNGTNIITYTHNMARLYFDEDDCDSDSSDSSDSGYEEMPPPFVTQPSLIPLLFSYC